MLSCHSCGKENPDGFSFCGFCAANLNDEQRPPATDERKIVTVLFCDLVGFTASSDSADPEDVRAKIRPYHRMLRAEIEAYGGTVEKFIGDAVMAVFGAPLAHEDDAERAVRAGLRILEAIEELNEADPLLELKVRVGIDTGEAVVALGARPEQGEGIVTGDVVNTASRLQGTAPIGGVGVGEGTYRATDRIFDYEELDAVKLKGKADPVAIWWAKEARSRFGVDLTRTHDTPFIGREIDLALLKGIFDKAVAANSVQLVTVVGEPGLGKSRIVAELFAYIDARPELITWRQGRCLPYGEGITFWALGEILKAHTGILESDPPDVALTKLDATLPEGPERAWFRQRLLPLLGLEASSPADREELFTAWRRFLEQIAEVDPSVLVFEDLHWADDAMLGFLEHLADRAEGVPLLVIGTARPELFERHPDFGAGLRNGTPINLSPLSSEETARLVSALLQTTVIPAELQQPILERSGGNPLYAEEFVRLLKDKELLVRKGSSWELKEGVEVPFPDSVQALIAARLDTLGPEPKSMLADAAVVGKVFWAGAVAAMGERDLAEVTDALRELSRKELVRPARRSSIEGEAEHAFFHILTRDVAYARLPRASRASRHVAAAAWIESKAPERVEDLADVLAYHYATALELARVSGQTEQADGLQAPALRFLTLAGERALGLDTAAALGNFERALALTPPEHPERPEALARFGEAAFHAGRLVEAAGALDEAITSFLARGDPAAASRAMTTLGNALRSLGDSRRWTLAEEALTLLQTLPPGPELVGALTELAASEALTGKLADGVRYADQALTLGEELSLDRSARALGFRGLARCELGDPGGLEDMREAIVLATEAGQGREAAVHYNNLGEALWLFEGPVASLEIMRLGIGFAQARGLAEMVTGLTTSTLAPLFDNGELDVALANAAILAGRFEDDTALDLIAVRAAQARIMAMRGQAVQMLAVIDWMESRSRGEAERDYVILGLESSALARAGLGQDDRVASLLALIEATPRVREGYYHFVYLPALVRTALALGDRELAERFVDGVNPHYPYAEHALVAANAALAEARGDLRAAAEAYAEAADRWDRFGVVPERGFALLARGRCLVGLVRPNEASNVLRQAREIFDSLAAAPALSETDVLLQKATALSS